MISRRRVWVGRSDRADRAAQLDVTAWCVAAGVGPGAADRLHFGAENLAP